MIIFQKNNNKKIKKKIVNNLYIHIILIIQLVKIINGQYPCICDNLSKKSSKK